MVVRFRSLSLDVNNTAHTLHCIDASVMLIDGNSHIESYLEYIIESRSPALGPSLGAN